MATKAEGQGAAQSPFDAVMLLVGQDGLQLKKAITSLSLTEASILNNAVPVAGGQLLTRFGQTSVATGSGIVHSIKRLNDPAGPGIGNPAFTRFWGVGGSLDRGATGPLSVLDINFSGNPLTMVPFRPPLSGASYMYIADTVKMRKASVSGPLLPVGLPKPVSPPTVAVYATYITSLAEFAATDGTQAASWTMTAGVDNSGTPAAPPQMFDEGAGSVRMRVQPGAAASAYSSIASLATVRDLTTLNQPGPPLVVATDDDELGLTMRVNDPADVAEVRLYVVVSNNFLEGVIPGTSVDNNTDAYVKSFRPNDFQQFISFAKNTALTTGQALRTNQLVDTFVTDNSDGSTAPGQDTGTMQSTAMSLGAQANSLFGSIGLPCRRGEYTRIGGNTTFGWQSVTGMVIVVQMATNVATDLAFSQWRLHGGAGLDSATPGNLPYDYRVTNFDPRTGAESNPSDVSTTTIDSDRQPILMTPPVYGDAAIRQRGYRRGGTANDNWYFLGTNNADGAQFVDGVDLSQNPVVADHSDTEVIAAGPVNIDHDQPVTTVDVNGNAVFNQPLRTIWGTVAGMIMGCGDPNRPGAVYWCIPGEPDHWPAANWVEVCAPSEELMNGGVFGGQAFTFSRERGYLLSTNLAGIADTIVGTPTDCTPGMASYWGICIGPDGIYYVAKDGVRITKGGESMLVSDQIRPLFNGQSRNGLLPIDFTHPESLRLEAFNNDIHFTYKDTGGTLRTQVYSIIYKTWRQVTFANIPTCFYSDPTQGEAGQTLLMGCSGAAYAYVGTTDNGTAIACQFRTGALDFGNPRGDMMYGDIIVDANMGGSNALQLITLVNEEQTQVGFQSAAGLATPQRYLFDAFGSGTSGPQKARNLSIDLQWSGTAGVSPIIERVGVTLVPQPQITMNRVTSWDTPGESEGYLMGVWIDADTGTTPRSVHIECDLNGVISEPTGSPFTINPTGLAGRHKWWFSWPVIKANMIRLRPEGSCAPWELYSYRWLVQEEPPRIAVWDTNTENKQNAYCTGVNLECDTFGVNKTIQIQIDGVTVSTQTVNSTGRKLVQLTIQPPVRGSTFRFAATDANVGLLYSWNWLTDPEPGLQTNWNQNYTPAGTLADKWLKGALIECDTFGLNKTVTFEIDGVVIDTETINTSGRSVVEVSFPQQLGRIFRMIPTDANPGRLYSMEWIFDEEPMALSRWETQELDLGVPGWKVMPASWVTIKSTAQVNLNVTVYGQSGVVLSTPSVAMASTGGIKQKIYVPFAPNKGMLYKFVFTSAAKFWLYREESLVYVQPWGSPEPTAVKPFGNDDLDLVRGMHHANLVAGKSGGGQG